MKEFGDIKSEEQTFGFYGNPEYFLPASSVAGVHGLFLFRTGFISNQCIIIILCVAFKRRRDLIIISFKVWELAKRTKIAIRQLFNCNPWRKKGYRLILILILRTWPIYANTLVRGLVRI